MKFKLIKDVEGEVKAPNNEIIKSGDVVELNDWLSEKALKNPDYELVAEKKATKKKATKKEG